MIYARSILLGLAFVLGSSSSAAQPVRETKEKKLTEKEAACFEAKRSAPPKRMESLVVVLLRELLDDLRSSDREVRVQACNDLEKLGPKALPALAALAKALGDPYLWVRSSAARALGAIGPAAATAVPELVKALRDPDEHVRLWAVYSLGRIGPKAKSAVPALLEKLNDDGDRGDRTDLLAWTANTLGEIGAEPEIVVPALAAALKREKTPSRRFGSMAFYATHDRHRALAEGLASFGKSALPVLKDLLEDSRADVRWSALYAIVKIGPEARNATDAIAKRVKDDDRGVAALAVYSLVDIEADSERAIPLMMDALRSKSDLVRFAAAKSLGLFGPKARAAVPMLVEEYKTGRIDVGGSRWVVGQSLKSIDPEAAKQLGVK